MADVEVARAVVTIVPTMEGAQKTITEELTSAASSSGVSNAGKTAGSNFASGISKALGVAAGVTTAVTTAAISAGSAFVGAAGDVAEYGDNIDKMSQKLGLSYDSFQKWDYVLGMAGVDISSMQAGIKQLTTQLDKAANGSAESQAMFEALGLSLDDLADMSREDVFGAVMKGFQGMADSTERAALANDLLGRSGQSLTPFFNSSVEDTEALMQAAEQLGMVMSDDAVKASAGFQDALDTMQRSLSGLKNNLMANFLPGITDVMSGLTEIFAGDADKGLGLITSGIDSVIDNLTAKLPGFVKVAVKIVESLATAIMDNLPALADAALSLLGTIADFVVQNLPRLIEVAVNILMTVADGLIENLPVIIPAVVDMVLAIVDKLTQPDMIAQLIDASLQIIIALTEGLFNALPKLIERLPEIIVNIVTGLIKAAPALLEAAGKLIDTLIQGIINVGSKLISVGSDIISTIGEGIKNAIVNAAQWGRDLMEGFMKGIKEKWENLKSTVSNVAQTVKDFLGFSEPEEGPLSDFHTYAPDMIDLFTQGLQQSRAKISGTLDSVLTLPDASMDSASVGAGGAITIPIYLGDDLLDTVIVNANQRISLRSGGTA